MGRHRAPWTPPRADRAEWLIGQAIQATIFACALLVLLCLL